MTSRNIVRLLAAGAIAISGLGLASLPAGANPDRPIQPGQPSESLPFKREVPVRLLALNDFHGNLEPASGSGGEIVDEDGKTVKAGGAVYIAAHLKRLRDRNTLTVAQGDMIGGSPLISAAYHDEPSVEFLGRVGVTASAVGNHELDEGFAELQRIMKGGCHPVDGCSPEGKWKGAKYDYVAANILYKKNGKHAVAPFTIRKVNGVKVGLIGAVTQITPTIVTPSGVKDLKFTDEVEAVNRASAQLRRMGVRAQVVLVHEGDQIETGKSPDACSAKPGPGYRIATQSASEIDVILEGHSHNAYICQVKDPAGANRVYSQGGSNGRVITQVDLKVDRRTGDVVRSTVKADNHVVTQTIAPDPETEKFVAKWKAHVSEVGDKVIGKITATLDRKAGPSGETPLGNVIADAQLEATKAEGKAEIALMNAGGVRADLAYAQKNGEGDGNVTFGEAFDVQPFGNLMGVVTLTGADLKELLEQQFQTPKNRVMSPSANLSYTMTPSAAAGSRISDIKIDGKAVTPDQQIRVAANAFLLDGGDSFTAFTKGKDRWIGMPDLDAFTAYLKAHSPITPPATDRITVK
ncbi:bifunctional metallophosphatase/5'-nucleotidase [Bailinhaonella thermotolerans]|uniref:Bifunctional metallophosphatase/5'-nucleotidase n=1 Tax=Bailinhaonella thermotolerans TaxID=1070861 RepID=A0A3A4AR57_9ACTN|nr:bifunctional metallophosphatase/5'-nucleotidase [Bailinhaonella thermotolerans]RJL30895.1 bifunctional metallophosphatase/5'-nucleotidase [Bailinhaonella thermotolerans]